VRAANRQRGKKPAVQPVRRRRNAPRAPHGQQGLRGALGRRKAPTRVPDSENSARGHCGNSPSLRRSGGLENCGSDGRFLLLYAEHDLPISRRAAPESQARSSSRAGDALPGEVPPWTDSQSGIIRAPSRTSRRCGLRTRAGRGRKSGRTRSGGTIQIHQQTDARVKRRLGPAGWLRTSGPG